MHGWAFTLKQFSEMYAEKFKIDTVKLMNRLWGESFFNPKTKKWSKQKEADNKRSFCMYVLDPIYKVKYYVSVTCDDPSRTASLCNVKVDLLNSSVDIALRRR